MKRYDLLTPEGTRDLLFEECAAKRAITERVTRLFESYGYSEVVTPGLEFYDVFNGKSRYFPQESMYKLTDEKNRLMVLRPDSTMPIARLAATRLRDEKLPLKLFYSQNIFMVNPKDSGRDDEISQSGIEILGGEKKAADYEALVLAAKTLEVCDEDYILEIGDSGIFRELIGELNVSDEQEEQIHGFVETKNYPALNEALSSVTGEAAKALAALPKLFGGESIFEEAERYMLTPSLKDRLNELKALYTVLASNIDSAKLRVDLGLVHKRNYYTGIIFRGYVEDYGMTVLSGGRYDALLGAFGREAPAVGFSLNVEAAAKVLLKNGANLAKSPDVLVCGENAVSAMKRCDELISKGLTVCNSLFATLKEAENYAKAHNIHRIDTVDANGNVTEREV